MGFGSFHSQYGLFKRFWGYLWNFDWLKSFGEKEHGLLRVSEIFGEFWSVWSGLGPIVNKFFDRGVLLQNPQAHRDRGLIYNNLRGLITKW
jgi:hypothetical protein